MPIKRAIGWVLFWNLIAGISTFILYKYSNSEKAIEFITCYIIEWTLSIDNLFVFLLIFKTFDVEPPLQIRVLKWGIIGAIVMRLSFILMGVTLVKAFQPILYFFGALLIYSAIKMVTEKDKAINIKDNPLIRLARKRFSITKRFHGDNFFIRKRGVLIATPMLLVLITIESSDIIFAVDSIPAAFSITQDPMLIFAANFLAILGLRALYFLLAHADNLFSKLKYGVAIILAFVGVKIILEQLHISIGMAISLAVIIGCLGGSVLLSILTKNTSASENI
jgi:tellurite resistance protein TerC